MKGHCTSLWVVPPSSLWWCLRIGGHLPTYISPTQALHLGWQYSLDHRWEICNSKKPIFKSCRHSPMAEIGMTCTASLQTPQTVSTPPPPPRGADTRAGWARCSCPNILLYATCLASLCSCEGRQAHSQGASTEYGTCFYLGKSPSEKFTDLTMSSGFISSHFISSGIYWNTSIKALSNAGRICFLKKCKCPLCGNVHSLETFSTCWPLLLLLHDCFEWLEDTPIFLNFS